VTAGLDDCDAELADDHAVRHHHARVIGVYKRRAEQADEVAPAFHLHDFDAVADAARSDRFDPTGYS